MTTMPTDQERSAPFVPGAVLRALGSLVDSDAISETCRVVHLAPHEGVRSTTGEAATLTRVEAIHGRVFVRATYEASEAIDQGVLIDARTCGRCSGDEYVEIDGARIVKPFGLEVEPDDGSGAADEYPALDELALHADQRLLAVAAAKDLKKALSVLVACGCDQVEILAPRHRGGSIGLRGVSLGLRVEASLLSEEAFDAPSARERDVAGQATIRFDARSGAEELAKVAEDAVASKPRGRRRRTAEASA